MRVKKLLLLSWSICLILVLAALPFMTACSTDDVETPTNGDTETPTNGDTETPTNETLKIGYIGYLGFSVGLDLLYAMQVRVDMINEQGGLTIGDETYDIELISYDSNADQATIMAATNRLIFEDEVKFIVGDSNLVETVLPITEANQVIFCTTAMTPEILSPDNHYSFLAGFSNTATTAIVGWFAQNYPDENSIVLALPDSERGQVGELLLTPIFEVFDIDVDCEYYPPDSTDLSSLGTKVKTLDPDVLMTVGGTMNVYRAAREAGWDGQLLNVLAVTTDSLLSSLTVEMAEGLLGSAVPAEFEPALTDMAQEFKEAWIAEFGSWEGPDIQMLANFECIIAALQEAGTLDTDAVADVISNGLEFDTPVGPVKMMSRPDLGNDRTVDSVGACYVKQIVGGESTLFYTIGIDEALSYFQLANQ